MSKQINNLWLRICGIFATIFGVFVGSNSKGATNRVSFTPDYSMDCEYSCYEIHDGILSPEGLRCIGDPIPYISGGSVIMNGQEFTWGFAYSGTYTRNTRDGVPWFCWNKWAIENKDEICEEAFGASTGAGWSCGTQQQNREYGFYYQSCTRVLGPRCRLVRNHTDGIWDSVVNYGGGIETAWRIIGCINSSDTMAGSDALGGGGIITVEEFDGQVYCYDNSSFCPSPGWGLEAHLSAPSAPQRNNCYIWLDDTWDIGMYDSTGHFIYDSACSCYYDGRSVCS